MTKRYRTRREYYEATIPPEYYQKLCDREYTYVSVHGAPANQPSQFVIWLAKPMAEVEERARSFIRTVYGTDLEFSLYPRNYFRGAKDLVALGMHEHSSPEIRAILFRRAREMSLRREEALRQHALMIEHAKKEGTYNPNGIYTGTYIGDMSGMSLPMWRDTQGHVHLAPDWMQNFSVGQKMQGGVPVDTLQYWSSEHFLYRIVAFLFPDRDVLLHYRGPELGGLELDIWIPDLKVGIEYQGLQHFESVEHWGGEDGLERRRINDKKKKQLCSLLGYRLIEVSHEEELSVPHIQERLRQAGIALPSDGNLPEGA